MHVSDFILCLCHTCGKSYICQIFCWKRILSSFAACHKEVWKHTGCYLDGFPPAETWHNHVYTGTHWLQFRRKWGCHHQNSGSHDGIHVACFRMKMETLAICDYFELNNKSFQWGSNIRPRPSSFEIGQFGSFCDFIYVGVKAEVCATGEVWVNR